MYKKTESKERKYQRSIGILVVTSLLMNDENAVLFLSCLLHKHIDVQTMSIYTCIFDGVHR